MNEILDNGDPFAEVDQETIDRMAELRGEKQSTPRLAPVIAELPRITEADVLKAQLQEVTALKDKAVAQVAFLKASKSGNGSSCVNADGSLTLVVTISQDIALSLSPWEELEGMNLEETARKYIPIALEAYINGA